MNLYFGLAVQGVLTTAQFLVVPFTPQFDAGQHSALNGCIAALQLLVATYQHMSAPVSFQQPTPPSPPTPQPPPLR
jgi:hypothetical protein